MSCARARCNDPDCLVCTTIERGFTRAVFREEAPRRRRPSPPDQPQTTTVEQSLFDCLDKRGQP
jgi:hypothetical protein